MTFSGEISIEKTEEGKKCFQNKRVSSQNQNVEEEGATVAASHLPFPAGSFVIRLQAGPAAFFHGVIQTIGKTPLTT